VDNQSVQAGAKVTEPSAPIRPGFTFGGWYSDEALTAAYNFDSPVNSNLTLYAKWNTISADKSALTAAITGAETAVSGVTVSVDGSEVNPEDTWITQAQKDAYQTAIDAAKTVQTNTAATQAQVDQAVDDLAAATATFNSAKKPGTKPNINNESPLKERLDALKDGETLILYRDESLKPYTISGRTVILKSSGSEERVIQLNGNGSLFTLEAGGKLILDQGVSLKGVSSNTCSLVYVNGTLTMKAGAKILGNTIANVTSANGGCVYFDIKGTFTM
jgi:uncharacterized repeat protein (TIGR02543 family)